MSIWTGVGSALRGEPAGDGDREDHVTLEITGTAIVGGYLSLDYTVSHVHTAADGHYGPRGASSDGLAVADRHTVLRDCRCSYRAGSGRVAGTVMIGPEIGASTQVRVVFAPLAYTFGYEREVCELDVHVEDGTVVDVAARMQ